MQGFGFSLGPQTVVFPHILTYAKDADEFVRQNTCRERTGWRREEWAHSPLFICGKFTGVNAPKTVVPGRHEIQVSP